MGYRRGGDVWKCGYEYGGKRDSAGRGFPRTFNQA